MASLFSNLGFKSNANSSAVELPEIFEFLVVERDFISIDLETIYSRILTDVLERTEGLGEELEPLLWDNVVKSNTDYGVVTLLSKAMVEKSDLFLVYDKALKLVTKATGEEQSQIKKDYEEKGESQVGVYISFKNWSMSDMLKVYSALDYNSVSALHKTMNLAKIIMLKLKNLRSGIGLAEKDSALKQVEAIAKGMSQGKDVVLDSEDMVEMLTPNLDSTEKSMAFVSRKQSLYLGLPASYINGILKGGLGDSGEADARAIERGLKKYFYSIIKPVGENLFGLKELTFRTEDHTDFKAALETLKTFELTSEAFLSGENKQKILNSKFNLSEDAKGDETPPPTVNPNGPPVQS